MMLRVPRDILRVEGEPLAIAGLALAFAALRGATVMAGIET
jgi:hypothetical protein